MNVKKLLNPLKILWQGVWGLLAVIVWIVSVGLGGVAAGRRGMRIIAGR